jgi:hypothetical protein
VVLIANDEQQAPFVYNTRSSKLACKGLILRRFSYLKYKNLGFYGKTTVLQRFCGSKRFNFL